MKEFDLSFIMAVAKIAIYVNIEIEASNYVWCMSRSWTHFMFLLGIGERYVTGFSPYSFFSHWGRKNKQKSKDTKPNEMSEVRESLLSLLSFRAKDAVAGNQTRGGNIVPVSKEGKAVCTTKQNGSTSSGSNKHTKGHSVPTTSSTTRALRLNPDLATLCGIEAEKYADNFDKYTQLIKSKRTIAELNRDELHMGKVLGRGAFCQVRSSRLCNDNNAKKYAIKFLDRNKVLRPTAAVDLVMEAKFLSCFDHPNIIQLHGVTKGPLSQAFAKPDGYFLLLERMEGALEYKLQEWSDEMTCQHVPSLQRRLQTIAFDVCAGMSFLHSKNVVFRDLKPSNVGFSSDGTFKLLDFGLATEIISTERRLTGKTGSRPYMAPEVALSEHYGLSADVFSFGVLLWEVCSLKKLSSNEARNLSDIHSSLHVLLNDCGKGDASKRPSFHDIHQSLLKIVDGLGSSAKDARRSFRLLEMIRFDQSRSAKSM